MRMKSIDTKCRLTGAVLLAMLLAGCDRPVPPGDEPKPEVPPPQASMPSAAADLAGATREPPPSAGSAPAPAADEPPLASMKLASASSKLGVPVDLRYQFDGDALAGSPATLHLAAVPRVAGSHLSVSIKEEAGIQAMAAPLTAQKASASTVYRQQLSVTRLAGGPRELRVLVTMDLPEGSAFSYFSVPFEGTPRGSEP